MAKFHRPISLLARLLALLCLWLGGLTPLWAEPNAAPPPAAELLGRASHVIQRVHIAGKEKTPMARDDAMEALYEFKNAVKEDRKQNTRELISETQKVQTVLDKLQGVRKVVSDLKESLNVSKLYNSVELERATQNLAQAEALFQQFALTRRPQQLAQNHQTREVLVDGVTAELIEILQRSILSNETPTQKTMGKEIAKEMLPMDPKEEKALKELLEVLIAAKTDIPALKEELERIKTYQSYKGIVFQYNGPIPINGEWKMQEGATLAPATVLAEDIAERIDEVPGILNAFVSCLKDRNGSAQSPYKTTKNAIDDLAASYRKMGEAVERKAFLKIFPSLTKNKYGRAPTVLKHHTWTAYMDAVRTHLHYLLSSRKVAVHSRTGEVISCDTQSTEFRKRLGPAPIVETGRGAHLLYLDWRIFWALATLATDHVTKLANDEFAKNAVNRQKDQVLFDKTHMELYREGIKRRAARINHWLEVDLKAVGAIYEDLIGSQMFMDQKALMATMKQKREFAMNGMRVVARRLVREVAGVDPIDTVDGFLENLNQQAYKNIREVYRRSGTVARTANHVATEWFGLKDARDAAGLVVAKMTDHQRNFVASYEALKSPCNGRCDTAIDPNDPSGSTVIDLGEDLVFEKLKTEAYINELIWMLYGDDKHKSEIAQIIDIYNKEFPKGLQKTNQALAAYRAAFQGVTFGALGTIMSMGMLGLASPGLGLFVSLGTEVVLATGFTIADIQTGRHIGESLFDFNAIAFACVMSTLPMFGLSHLAFAVRRGSLAKYLVTRVLVSHTVTGALGGAAGAGLTASGMHLALHGRLPTTTAELRMLWRVIALGGAFGGILGLVADGFNALRNRGTATDGNGMETHRHPHVTQSSPNQKTLYRNPFDNPDGYFPQGPEALECGIPFKFPYSVTSQGKRLEEAMSEAVELNLRMRSFVTTHKDRPFTNDPARNLAIELAKELHKKFPDGQFFDLPVGLRGQDVFPSAASLQSALKKIEGRMLRVNRVLRDKHYPNFSSDEEWYKALEILDSYNVDLHINTARLVKILRIREQVLAAIPGEYGKRFYNIYGDQFRPGLSEKSFRDIAEDVQYYLDRYETGVKLLEPGFNFEKLSLAQQKQVDTIAHAILRNSAELAGQKNQLDWRARPIGTRDAIIGKALGKHCPFPPIRRAFDDVPSMGVDDIPPRPRTLPENPDPDATLPPGPY